MEETCTSSRVPGFMNAGMSAVTITTPTFLEERVVAGTLIAVALEQVGDGLLGIHRVLIAIAREAHDQAVADELVVPGARDDDKVAYANPAGGKERRGGQKEAQGQ